MLADYRVDEIHLGRADEARNEQVAREIIQVLGGIVLLDNAVFHNDDTVAHGHRFGLVVGNVNEGGLETLVQAADLRTHCGTELGVQVGQRLVEQEYGGVTHHRAAQGDTLALAAGKRFRLAVEQVLQVECLCGFVYLAVDFVFRNLLQAKAERDIFIYSHMRIQRVVLEYHRDIAVLRGNVVNNAVADIQLTVADIFQAGDHAQGGRFAAAGRADQNDEFFVLNLKVQVGYNGYIAGINLFYMLKADACHNFASSASSFRCLCLRVIYLPAAAACRSAVRFTCKQDNTPGTAFQG